MISESTAKKLFLLYEEAIRIGDSNAAFQILQFQLNLESGDYYLT